MTQLSYRPARVEDWAQVNEIFLQAQALLKEGGIDQWQDQDSFSKDELGAMIDDDSAYVWEDEAGILAFMQLADGDSDYEKYDSWETPVPYLALHRVMIADRGRGMGLSQRLFEDAEKLAQSRGYRALRIDTHEDNERMQHVIKKFGFTYVAPIKVKANLPRLAYEKDILSLA